MPPPQLLHSWNSWEAGIGYIQEDGTPGLCTANKILGLKGELRPAPVSTQIAVDAEAGHHFQYFFE